MALTWNGAFGTPNDEKVYPRICPGRYLALDVALAVLPLDLQSAGFLVDERGFLTSQPAFRSFVSLLRGHATGLKARSFSKLKVYRRIPTQSVGLCHETACIEAAQETEPPEP